LNGQPVPAARFVAARIGRKLGSLCYEILLLAAIVFVAGWSFLPFEPLLPPAIARLLLQLYVVAVSAAYFIYCWTRNGQTLPMKTWRIRVVNGDGTAVTLKTGAKRYLFALAGLALCGAGFWWALVDRDGQFLHDRLAGTRIVQN
jgi:uncharacterized RDD family membrane protein YckC